MTAKNDHDETTDDVHVTLAGRDRDDRNQVIVMLDGRRRLIIRITPICLFYSLIFIS